MPLIVSRDAPSEARSFVGTQNCPKTGRGEFSFECTTRRIGSRCRTTYPPEFSLSAL